MITIQLPLPPSANRYWRMFRGRMVVSAEAKAFKTEAGWIAKAAGAEVMTGPLSLSVDVYRERKSGDLDNKLKIILDSLQGMLYENDSQIVEIHARLFDDKKNPRAIVSVQSAPGAK